MTKWWRLTMTVSIRRMTLGSGYKYLMSSVAQSDGASQHASALTRYYAESGTPPGRFLGQGLAGLDNGHGVQVGSKVTEEHLFRMLGMLQDPMTGEQLGRPPRRGGRAYIDARGVTRKPPLPVAGFDLTFSAPKSVSVAWAVADEATQGLIYAAHQAALEHVIGYAEEHLFRMLGMVQDPLTGEQLGRPPRAQRAPYAERVRTRISTETAGLKGEERDAKVLKIKTEQRTVESKIARAVAGFVLTFSAPKSVSVAWALADGGTQAVIYEAHQQALAYVLRYAEQCVFTSRSGKNGVVQEEIRGVVAAAFDHWD